MREICMSGSMSEVWKRSHGRTNKAPPDERGGNRHVRPKATAPHLDSTNRDWFEHAVVKVRRAMFMAGSTANLGELHRSLAICLREMGQLDQAAISEVHASN